MKPVAIIGLDIAKTVFQVHGVNPKFLQPNRRFPRRFKRLRLKGVARQCLRCDGGDKIKGLPLLWVSLGGEGEGPHTGLCVLGAHGIAHDGGKMRK